MTTSSRPQQKNRKHTNVPFIAEKHLKQKNRTKITSQTATEHEHRNEENLSDIFKLVKFSIRPAKRTCTKKIIMSENPTELDTEYTAVELMFLMGLSPNVSIYLAFSVLDP
ncbi:hypothetical protein Tco_1434327 [Tanacetum coccineum]